MKVLYYNWADYEDPEGGGGGVSVYQKNLIAAALAAGDAPAFLSSGTSYGLVRRRPYVRRVGAADRGVRKFEVVNSPVLSPGGAAFGADAAADPAMEALFADFLRREGPFAAVHFNNLEGIPASLLRVAKGHAPGARVVVGLHNYFPFCPQVNLWFQERENCRDYAGGRKCATCLPADPDPVGVRRFYAAQTLLRRLGAGRSPRLHRLGLAVLYRYLRPLYRRARGVLRRPPAAGTTLRLLDREEADRFAGRRAAFVGALNRDADHVLAVSRRVAEVAVRMGVRPDKVSTAYIGTRFGGAPAAAREPWAGGRPLSLAYLGYMRRDKGFYFLLDALERMPAGLAGELSLTVAAKLTDPEAVARLRRVAHRFAAVTLVDGYTHATLPGLLAGVDLGVVPVLWEDNLPQVAIEMVGSGVPVLCSDLGGARELLDCPELTFRAGSASDLYARLRGVLASPGVLGTAMAGRARLWTPAEHYELLRGRYYTCGAAARPPGDFFGKEAA
jgi:glycosyltransferase involved in cell wall biosynthesis